MMNPTALQLTTRIRKNLVFTIHNKTLPPFEMQGFIAMNFTKVF